MSQAEPAGSLKNPAAAEPPAGGSFVGRSTLEGDLQQHPQLCVVLLQAPGLVHQVGDVLQNAAEDAEEPEYGLSPE